MAPCSSRPGREGKRTGLHTRQRRGGGPKRYPRDHEASWAQAPLSPSRPALPLASLLVCLGAAPLAHLPLDWTPGTAHPKAAKPLDKPQLAT